MTHTVHLDRQGYVDTVLCGTRKATLDARRYPGTLMEVDGDVCVGWHWDGQKFSLPPPRITQEAVRKERDRRIETPFPKGFRDQATALGGDNALAVTNYVSAVMKVAEAFGEDAPADYRDDRHWPKVPKLRDMPVPRAVSDLAPSAGAPVNITVAPVIHATPAEPKALVVEHKTVSDSVRVFDEYGLDLNDPLYEHKVRLIRFIGEKVDPNIELAPADIKEEAGRLAMLHTASKTLDELAERENQFVEFVNAKLSQFIEGKAA